MTPQTLKTLADAQFDRAQLLNNIRETATSQLTVVHNGGMFSITPSLIGFLATWNDTTVYIEDIYNNPILVNRVELLTAATATYQAAMETWYIEFQKANRIRKAINV